MIDEQLLAVHIPRKAADAIVEGDDVGIEAVQEVIEGIERRIRPQVDTSISARKVMIPF